MFLYIAQPDCLYVVLLQRLKELALCNRILTLRKTVNEPDSRQPCGTFLNAPWGWRTSATRSLSCKVASGVNPVISANCDQRWTFSVLTFAPKYVLPSQQSRSNCFWVCKVRAHQALLTAFHASHPASMRITSHSGRCTSASIASGVNPCTFPWFAFQLWKQNEMGDVRDAWGSMAGSRQKTTGQWDVWHKHMCRRRD